MWLKCNYSGLLKQTLKVDPAAPKKPDPPPLVRGREHHDALEAYVRGIKDEGDLPKDLKKHIEKFDWRETRERYASNPANFVIEDEWAFDKDWAPCDWFAPTVWGRAKIDRGEWLDTEHTVFDTVDYKTGKKFGNEVKHGMQMQTYAAIIFTRYPSCQEVRVRLQYTDDGKETSRAYNREQAALFLRIFGKQAMEMTTATYHKPRPSKINCAYCPYGPNNDGSGVCEYGVETK